MSISEMTLSNLFDLHNHELTEEEFEELQEHDLVKRIENLGYSSSHSGCYWWDVELVDGSSIDVFTSIEN